MLDPVGATRGGPNPDLTTLRESWPQGQVAELRSEADLAEWTQQQNAGNRDHALIIWGIGFFGSLQVAGVVVMLLQLKESRRESRRYFEALREEMRLTRQESRRMVRAFVKRILRSNGHQS